MALNARTLRIIVFTRVILRIFLVFIVLLPVYHIVEFIVQKERQKYITFIMIYEHRSLYLICSYIRSVNVINLCNCLI